MMNQKKKRPRDWNHTLINIYHQEAKQMFTFIFHLQYEILRLHYFQIRLVAGQHLQIHICFIIKIHSCQSIMSCCLWHALLRCHLFDTVSNLSLLLKVPSGCSPPKHGQTHLLPRQMPALLFLKALVLTQSTCLQHWILY